MNHGLCCNSDQHGTGQCLCVGGAAWAQLSVTRQNSTVRRGVPARERLCLTLDLKRANALFPATIVDLCRNGDLSESYTMPEERKSSLGELCRLSSARCGERVAEAEVRKNDRLVWPWRERKSLSQMPRTLFVCADYPCERKKGSN